MASPTPHPSPGLRSVSRCLPPRLWTVSERQYFPSFVHLLAICVCPKVSEKRKRGDFFVVWEYAHIFLYKLMVIASLLYAVLA